MVTVEQNSSNLSMCGGGYLFSLKTILVDFAMPSLVMKSLPFYYKCQPLVNCREKEDHLSRIYLESFHMNVEAIFN